MKSENKRENLKESLTEHTIMTTRIWGGAVLSIDWENCTNIYEAS